MVSRGFGHHILYRWPGFLFSMLADRMKNFFFPQEEDFAWNEKTTPTRSQKKKREKQWDTFLKKKLTLKLFKQSFLRKQFPCLVLFFHLFRLRLVFLLLFVHHPLLWGREWMVNFLSCTCCQAICIMNACSVTDSMKAYQLYQMDWPPYNSSGTTHAQLDSKNNQLNTIIRAVIKTNVLSTDLIRAMDFARKSTLPSLCGSNSIHEDITKR